MFAWLWAIANLMFSRPTSTVTTTPYTGDPRLHPLYYTAFTDASVEEILALYDDQNVSSPRDTIREFPNKEVE